MKKLIFTADIAVQHYPTELASPVSGKPIRAFCPMP